MALRNVQVLLPETDQASLETLMKNERLVSWWREGGLDQRVNLQYLLPAEETEELLDSLEQQFGKPVSYTHLTLPTNREV